MNNPFDGPGHSHIGSWNGRVVLERQPTTAGKDIIYLNGVACAASTSRKAVGTIVESYG